MTAKQRIWLVVNDASGGSSQATVAAMKRSCRNAGFALARVVTFPQQPLPAPARLEAEGIGVVAVFAGDGTVNALVEALVGWAGAVLVLPGGTMNLVYHRLHGQRGLDEVIGRAAAGAARAVRPGVIRCAGGAALADLLAGPGTSWYDVREAMREADPLAVADSAAHALGETLATAGIACREPQLGRAQGYPLVMLTPCDSGIRVAAFHAETVREYLQEGWAVLRRRFREGPHDDLGLVGQVTLASTAGAPFGILLDGERAESPAEEVFRLVPCGVDLLATAGDGR